MAETAAERTHRKLIKRKRDIALLTATARGPGKPTRQAATSKARTKDLTIAVRDAKKAALKAAGDFARTVGGALIAKTVFAPRKKKRRKKK